jgi:uncharacterized protein YndB with AHSA1/START domain
MVQAEATEKVMNDKSYTTSFTVDASAIDAYRAINDVRSWWNEDITGDAKAVGAEFTHEVKEVHQARIQVIELVPGKRVVWRVLDNWFGFVDDESEWVDTEIRFELSEIDGQTEVRFTHLGLVPAYECYEACENAWGMYIGGSLRSLIATGKGLPNSSPGERRHQEMLASEYLQASA